MPSQVQSLKRKQVTQVSLGGDFVIMLGRDISLEEQKMRRERKLAKKAKQEVEQMTNILNSTKAGYEEARQRYQNRAESIGRQPL